MNDPQLTFLILLFNFLDNLGVGLLIRSRDIGDFECTDILTRFEENFLVKVHDLRLQIVSEFASNIKRI